MTGPALRRQGSWRNAIAEPERSVPDSAAAQPQPANPNPLDRNAAGNDDASTLGVLGLEGLGRRLAGSEAIGRKAKRSAKVLLGQDALDVVRAGLALVQKAMGATEAFSRGNVGAIEIQRGDRRLSRKGF